MKLKSLFQTGRVVVTAHRGFSGLYPENTLTAFAQAVETGADIVEFDVGQSRDGQLVILHDDTLDRTTNGQGRLADHTWNELANLNATYWSGPHNSGQCLAQPTGREGLPRLEDALELLAGRVGMNIQIKSSMNLDGLKRVVELYLAHQLQDSAFLMLPTFEVAQCVRNWADDVAICVGEARADLDRHCAFNVDFLQPTRSTLQVEGYLPRLLEWGAPFSVFYANDVAAMANLLDQGVRGILTDRPDMLIEVARARGLK
jgi:glycerophosphoryl diester phosphodiesterase